MKESKSRSNSSLSLMLPLGCEPRCRGCLHRELSAVESEKQKTGWLADALASWRDVIEPLRSVSGEARWNYRDKTVLHANLQGGRWVFGMKLPKFPGARRSSDFEILAIPNCPVHTARVRSTLAWLSEVLPGDLPLSYVSISGAIFSLVLKQAETSESRLRDLFLSKEEDLKRLHLRGAFAHFNPSTGNRVFSNKGWVLLWGEESVDGYGPRSFQQLIPELHGNALGEAEGWLDPDSGSLVFDLYSGVGTTVRRWKSRGARTIGVELMGESVRFAGAEVLQGRVEDRIPQLTEAIQDERVLLYANPPRIGMEPQTLDWIGHVARPERIAYLSCSAGTLARDLSKLEEYAYRVRRIIPYDFFPQTHHVETLACLERDRGDGVSRSLSHEWVRRPQ